MLAAKLVTSLGNMHAAQGVRQKKKAHLFYTQDGMKQKKKK